MVRKLTENMRRVLTVLRLFGPQPTSNLIQINDPGTIVWTAGRRNYFLASLRHMEEDGLIELVTKDYYDMDNMWKITEKGKGAEYGDG